MLLHKIQGALVASAIGDALGWITEFEKSLADIEHKYGVAQITDFATWSKRVGGRFHGYNDEILPGEYSDDTQLALCTARCITAQGHFDVACFTELEFPFWLDYARGAGSTVVSAVNAIGSDTDSIAAFAGSLVGCLNGIQAIPTRWKNRVQDGSYLVHIGERLAAIANCSSLSPFDPEEYRDTANDKGPNPKLRKDERVYHPALGYGHIQTVDHQVTLNGKEVVLVRVTFDLGQSTKFAIRDINKNPLRAPVQDRLF
jgi:hypothetical protein